MLMSTSMQERSQNQKITGSHFWRCTYYLLIGYFHRCSKFLKKERICGDHERNCAHETSTREESLAKRSSAWFLCSTSNQVRYFFKQKVGLRSTGQGRYELHNIYNLFASLALTLFSNKVCARNIYTLQKRN
jgi:hypothetical protein